SIVDNATNEVINDQAVYITAKDVLNAIQGPLAERLQRTVAPLLSEFADKWIGGSKFMPYAVPFSPPEANMLANAHCGVATKNEGLLPVADNTGPCATTWGTATVAGDGVSSGGCTTPAAPAPVVCSFTYYQFTLLGLSTLGITGAGSVIANVQANAPHAAETFRQPLRLSDFSVTAGAASFGGLGFIPKTDGSSDMSVQATVSSTDLCRDSLLSGLTCTALVLTGLTTPNTVTFQFPQLATASLAGSKLSMGAKNGRAGPFDLLNPTTGDPHYWFIRNQWYRYTYYAVSPNTSAAQTGGELTVSGFPAANGLSNDKRFVLALMGPAVTGQTRSATAPINQYLEGQNAVMAGPPRTFAHQVYAASGNDRIATCPFNDGATPCD
ncbi:MAG: hypothetical protein ABR570_05995, partial [Burkholderiales bacterium]